MDAILDATSDMLALGWRSPLRASYQARPPGRARNAAAGWIKDIPPLERKLLTLRAEGLDVQR